MSCQHYETPAAAGVAHGSFTLERTYPASVERVWATWADAALKARWFVGPEGWTAQQRELDFREGGHEVCKGTIGDVETSFTARYHDIVPQQRIVYTYDMHLSGTHHSVSIASVQLKPTAQGTQFIFTEQVTFLDGTDGVAGTASRQHGTAAHLDRIAAQF